VLNPLLEKLGVQLMAGILVESSKDEMPQMVKPYVTTAGSNVAEDQTLLTMKSTGDTLRLLMPGATAMAYAAHGAFTVSPLLMTEGALTWLKAGPLVIDSAAPVYSPQEGDIKGSFPTALALTRTVNQRRQRIIVCSDADFMSNLRNSQIYFGMACYSWLDEGKFPIYTPKPDPKDNVLRIGVVGVNTLYIVYVWVLPALLLLLGTILLIRRKRK
jgi:ABC-2 type transport system permease protein